MILHVTPSKFFRNTLNQYKQYITNQPVVICSKGFELESLSTLSDVAEQELTNVKNRSIFQGQVMLKKFH